MLRKLAPPKSKQSAEIAQSDAAKQVENETSKRPKGASKATKTQDAQDDDVKQEEPIKKKDKTKQKAPLASPKKPMKKSSSFEEKHEEEEEEVKNATPNRKKSNTFTSFFSKKKEADTLESTEPKEDQSIDTTKKKIQEEENEQKTTTLSPSSSAKKKKSLRNLQPPTDPPLLEKVTQANADEKEDLSINTSKKKSSKKVVSKKASNKTKEQVQEQEQVQVQEQEQEQDGNQSNEEPTGEGQVVEKDKKTQAQSHSLSPLRRLQKEPSSNTKTATPSGLLPRRILKEVTPLNQPEVHIIGEIVSGRGFGKKGKGGFACKWSIDYGMNWIHVSGNQLGQSQIARVSNEKSDQEDEVIWCHPIDLHFATSTSHGWPRLLLQVWYLDQFMQANVVGYAFAPIPFEQKNHTFWVKCWRPLGNTKEEIEAWFLGKTIELKSDEVVFNAAWAERCRLKTIATGEIQLNLSILLRNFFRH